MSFQQDIEDTTGLNGAYRPGLQALHPNDRPKLAAKLPRRLTGSANIDSALRNQLPQSPRWDYVVAWNATDQSECLHWIEVHPASGLSMIAVVSAKLKWLIEWLGADGSRLRTYRRRFVWVASGRSAFQQNSPQLKQLVSKGLYFAGGHYSISD